MSDFKDEWTAHDWETVKDCSRDLLYFAHYLKQRVDDGSSSITPDDVKTNISRAEVLLKRLKQAANYCS